MNHLWRQLKAIIQLDRLKAKLKPDPTSFWYRKVDKTADDEILVQTADNNIADETLEDSTQAETVQDDISDQITENEIPKRHQRISFPQLSWRRLPRFDRLMLLVLLGLSVLLGVLLWQTKPAPVRVSQFSWDGEIIGAQDTFFTLSFERLVDHDAVDKALTIEPALPGKISWRARKLFYTLTELPVYGVTYKVSLQNPTQTSTTSSSSALSADVEAFVSRIQTRDRAFAYIGITGEEQGKLVLYNINQESKVILTPQDLVVTEFALFPEGDRILFSAFSPGEDIEGITTQQLYTVTTGLNFANPQAAKPSGQIALILDAKTYQNQKFALATNGSAIIVQRENLTNPVDQGLWLIANNQPPRPLGIASMDFTMAPDGTSVAVSSPEGIVIIPLIESAKPAELLSGYGRLLSYSRDGRRQLVTRYNPEDRSRSLLLLNSTADPKEILRSADPIGSCTFEPRREQLVYCLRAKTVEIQKEPPPESEFEILPVPRVELKEYRLEPYLAAINLESKNEIALLSLPNYQDVQLSMSPDGLALLFDQVVSVENSTNSQNTQLTEQAIAAARLWLLPLPKINDGEAPAPSLPKALFEGFNPRWLP